MPDADDKRRIAELEAENRELRDTIKRLVARIEELERAGKRQAAPFSKGKPKQDPEKPGRKPGEEYGEHHLRARPAYDELVAALPAAPVVNADETGWKLGGHPAWAWAFVTKTSTVYWIDRSRGSDVLGKTLGFDFAGLLGRDGYAPYAKLEVARGQSCLAHHFVRATEVLATARRGAARFAHLVVEILRAALALRDRREELSEHGFAVERGKVEARMDRLLDWRPAHEPNERFRKHLARERPHLFTFLYEPSIEATNWPGEQAMRPLVVIRKNCGGGNRTPAGAEATQVIHSITRTCSQQDIDPLQFFGLAFRLPFAIPFGLAAAPSG